MNRIPFGAADMLLPDFSVINGEQWAVIACDQYTSEPDYWHEVEKLVADAPSALHMILPELYLNDCRAQRVGAINRRMSEYIEKGLLQTYPDAMIYVERTCRNGEIRRGIVGKIDLEAYSYAPDAQTPIRATEGTVVSRIPPRAEIRRHAEIELPHVMVLFDDAAHTVVAPLEERKNSFERAYSFPLMMGGGHVDGYFLPKDEIARVEAALTALPSANQENSFPFAVGDGNHSLASAKAHYEQVKAEIGEEKAASHPARYALVEIVNIHDAALVFEPIYRVAFGAGEALIPALEAYAAGAAEEPAYAENPKQTILCLQGGKTREIKFAHGTHSLTVGSLQNFLDEYCEKHPEVEVDYIHGVESLKNLSLIEGAVGFLFDGMEKSDLFHAVAKDGPLPRKTFSMGEAWDKRYYLEARKIK